MVLEPVLCPDCGSADVVRHGRYQYKSTLIGKSEFRRVDSGAWRRESIRTLLSMAMSKSELMPMRIPQERLSVFNSMLAIASNSHWHSNAESLPVDHRRDEE
jgi:hypothetical protein